MNKWTTRFLELAHVIASWSKDTTKVGSVIVDSKQRVVSLGFNGYARSVEDNLDVPRETRLKRVIHSEVNAILFARQNLEGTTLFVTHPPCSNCASVIIQSGIARVIYPKPDEAFALRWKDSMDESERMFNEAGVTLTKVE